MDNHAFQPQNKLKCLFFDLNSFFASVEQQDRPELRNKPIAVVPADTDTTCAIAASYEAKAYGIKTGTRIYEAKRLCPDLICVLARHDIYVQYHHKIFDEVERHIPIDKVCSIDEAACQLMENEQSLEQVQRLTKSIKQGLYDNVGGHIKCSIGVAQNAFLAKTATDMQKPDGFVILPPNNYKELLFKLPLSDLCGIGRNMERRLNCAGITTIEQLWNLSPKHARKVWGSVAGEAFWYRLHGYEVPEKATQKRVVGHSRVLDPQHRPSDQAYIIMKQLAVKACVRLRRYELYARRLSMRVKIKGQSREQRIYWAQDTSFSAAQDNFTILRALDKMWQQMQYETQKADLLKVSVNLYDLYKAEDITLDLFEQPNTVCQKQQDEKLSQAIDCINKRYGKQVVNIGVGANLKTTSGYVGTKIAFNRVPDLEEFIE